MKKAGLSIIGLIAFLYVFGQNYFPIVQENKEWNVMYVIFPGIGWDTVYWTNTYRFEGDTIINDTNYLKVYKSEEDIPLNWTFEGCIREDQGKKVFFRKWDNDYLIYDFGVAVGDTIEIYHNNYPESVRVELIDSIGIDGTIRKQILLKYLMYNSVYETWKEGIGSNRGILESGTAGYAGGWRWFLCISHNGQLIYMNPNYNTCYLISTGIEELQAKEIEIYPNPSSGKFTLRIPDQIKVNSATIYDFQGQMVDSFDYGKTELDLSGLSAGIYLLRLNYNSGKEIRKIIIE